MALVVKDRVRETTTTTGTGSVSLAGPVTGFQSFSVIGNANTTYYAIVDAATGEWEVGIGTYTLSGTTLSRDTVLESSNSGALVPFIAGTKDVFCTYPAERSVYADGTTLASPAANLTANGIPYASSTSALTTGSALTFDGTNMGIGTTAPTASLDVGGQTNTEVRIQTTASATAGDANLLLIGGRNTDAQLGRVRFYNNTTGSNVELARVQSSRDGANDAANLQFYTRPTGGSVTERMRIDSSGNVDIATTGARITGDFSNGTIGNRVSFQSSTTNGNTIVGFLPNGTATTGRLNVFNSSSTTNYVVGSLVASSSRVTVSSEAAGSATELPLAFDTAGAERMRLTSSGQLILNTTGTTYATGGVTAQYQIGGTTQAASSMSLITSNATTTTDPTIFLAKNKSGTQGTFTTAVVNTDELGAIRFAGSNTSTLATGAEIKGVSTATWSTTSQPTSLVFSTVGGGTTTLTERMRIAQDGEVLVGAQTSGITDVAGYGLTLMGPSSGGYLNFFRNDATVSLGNSLGGIDFYSNGSGSILYAATIGAEATGTFTASSTPTALTFDTCASGATVPEERMRIDSNGDVLIGTTVGNGVNYTVAAPSVQNVGTTEESSASSNVLWSTTASSEPHLILAKMKAATIGGTPAALASGDNIGRIAFVGSNGVTNTALEAANIFVEAAGTFTSTAAPSRMLFATGSTSGIATTRMTIESDGLVELASTSGLSIGRTAVTSPATTDGNVFSGTYTPTQVSTNTNVDSVTFVACQYIRVGSVVTVSGQITIDATTAATDTIVRMSVPIASNFSATRQLGGVGSSLSTPYATNNITCVANSAEDCVELRLRPSVNTSLTYNFSFTYLVS